MSEAVQVRPAREQLVAVGDAERSLIGWHDQGFALHLRHHLEREQPWCDVTCCARTFFQKVSPSSRQAVRGRLRHVARQMIAHRLFLVVEYAPRTGGTHGEAQKFKIYQGETENERQAAAEQLETMRRRKEVSDAQYDQARTILCIPVSALKTTADEQPAAG